MPRPPLPCHSPPAAALIRRGRSCYPPAPAMFPALMMSMVIVPVILGTMVGKRRRRRHAFGLLLGLMVVYDTFYMLMLFYLRVRWVGGGWLG